MADDRDRLIALRIGHLRFDERRDLLEDTQIRFDLLAYSRTPDFEDDRGAIVQSRPVDLSDGGRGARLDFEIAKHVEGERPSAASSARSSVSNGTGGTALWSFSNSAIQSGWKRSMRVASTCPSLSTSGPAVRARAACAAPVRDERSRQPREVQHLPGLLENVDDPDAPDEIAEAVPDQDRADVMQARQIPHDADRFPQHQPVLGGVSRCVGSAVCAFCAVRAAAGFCNASATPESMPLREVREARAEFARQFEARDASVDRENREAMRKIVHRERELFAGFGPYA